jgi:DNA-binding NarL/FixJ family response regulator
MVTRLNYGMLTKRKLEIIASLYHYGSTNAELAEHYSVTISTIKSHLNSIYRKLEVKHRGELVLLCRKANFDPRPWLSQREMSVK